MKAEDFLNQGTKPAKEGLPSKGMSAEEFLNMPAEEPIAPEPITEPAAEPGFAQGLYEQGKGAVSEFFRPSFAPEPTVPVGMEGMPEAAIPAGMPENIPGRRAEISERLGQVSADMPEAQELMGELEDLKQMEYGAEMARPISTITGEPVPTPEEEAAGGKAAMAIIPYGFASAVRGMVPGALERAVMDPLTKTIVGKEYVSPIDEALKIGKYLPEAGQVAIGAPAHMAGAIVPLSVSFKTAGAIMKAVGLPPDLVLRTGPVMDRITAHVARGGIAGAVYGGLEAGTPKGMAEDAAFFGALEGGLGAVGGIFRKIFSANWYRNLEVKERGLVVQSLDDMLAKGYSEGEILKQWNNPMWREEALARRAVGEPPAPAAPAAPDLSETQRELAKEVIREKMAEQPLPPAIPERQIPTVPPGMPPPARPPSAGPTPVGELPPGQGFGLVEPAPEIRLRPGPERIEGPEYPEGAEYVAGRPAPEELEVEHKPILSTRGLPWKEEKNALKALRSREDVSPATHKVVKIKKGYGIVPFADKRARVEAEAKPEEVKGKTLIAFVRAMGGIKDKTLPGEIRALSPKETGVVGLTTSVPDKGLGFDEMASVAVEYGWLPENIEDQSGAFSELLRDDIFAQKEKKPRVERIADVAEKTEREERWKEFEQAEDAELEYFAKHPDEEIDADLDQWQRETVEEIRGRNEADRARKIEESIASKVEAENPDLGRLKKDEGFPEYIEGWDEKDVLDEETLAELEAWRTGEEAVEKKFVSAEKRLRRRVKAPPSVDVAAMKKAFKPATKEEASAAAKKLGLVYDGVQEFEGKPSYHVFLDKEQKAIISRTVELDDIKEMIAARKTVKETAEKIPQVLPPETRTAIGEKAPNYLEELGGLAKVSELLRSHNIVGGEAIKYAYKLQEGKMTPEELRVILLKSAKPEISELIEKPVVEKIKIPELKNTEGALAFGKTATAEQVKALKAKRDESLSKSNALKAKGDLQGAMDEAVRGQLFREAIESAEGKVVKPKKGAEKQLEMTEQQAGVIQDAISTHQNYLNRGGETSLVLENAVERKIIPGKLAKPILDRIIKLERQNKLGPVGEERTVLVRKIHEQLDDLFYKKPKEPVAEALAKEPVLREPEAEYAAAQTKTPAFKKWFGDSKVVDEKGKPLVVYHGTSAKITEFDAEKSIDGGFHFGTSEQAFMRVAGKNKNIMPVYLSAYDFQRSKDKGGSWKSQIKTAKSYGKDGIVYLNRYEGITLESIKIARHAEINPDKLSDKKFKEWFPEAQDSYIVFKPTQIKSAIGNIGTFSETDLSILREPTGKYRQSELDLAFGGKKKADEAIESVAKEVEDVSRRGMPDRVAGEPAKSKVAEEMRKKKRVDLTDRKLTTGNESQEIAELFQVYRSPKMEILHAIYTNVDGTILAHNAITSGNMGAVNPGDRAKYIYQMKSTAKRLGAAKVHILHNHPSGNPTMSREDLGFANGMRKKLGRLYGEFIVIDHGKFTWVSKYGREGGRAYAYTDEGTYKVTPDTGAWMEKKGPLLKSPQAVAGFGNSLAYDKTKACFVYVDSGNNVVGWSTHDNKILKKSVPELEKILRQQTKGHGAAKAIIIAEDMALLEPIAEYGNVENWLLDALALPAYAEGKSLREAVPDAFRIVRKPTKPAWGLFEPEAEYGREVISKDGTTVDWDKSKVITKEKVTRTCYATYNKDGSFKKWRTREAINKIRALKKAEVKYKERLGKAKEKFDVRVEKIKTAKEILERRREKIKAIKDYFLLSDSDLKKITRKDIRLMSNFEFKQFIDDIRVKAERFAERRQALNELELLRKEKAFIAENNIRIFHKLPTIKKMTTEQLTTYAEILSGYEKGDQFLTPKRVKGLESTPWSGSKTMREVLEKASKEFDVPLSELKEIRVDEIDRFRYDTSLARRNPFYNFMVDEINTATIKNQFKYFKEREKLYRLAKAALKSRKRGIIGRLVPRQKELMKYMEAEGDAKLVAATELTTEEMALADAIEDFYRRAYNWLLINQELKSSRFLDSKYVFHSKRPLSELLIDLKDTGIKSAAKDLLNRWRLDEAQFKILDSKTGEILRMKKFFRQTLYRTGELTPTKNVIKATDIYMQQFFKKMALDESVPAIETLVMALRPKERTPTGIFLNDSLMTFVKEYLNSKKGRALNIGIQQGGKIDTVIRFVNQIISLRYIALNIPLELAAIVGETTAKLPALGNRKLILANMRRHTPRGRRILEKYKAFTGEGPFEEVLQPARNIGENINILLYGLFKWSRKVTKQDILLGNMTREEFLAETIDPKKLAEVTKMAGRWLDIEGSKSVLGTTSTGAAITKFKGWAIPIVSSTMHDATALARTLTRLGDPKKRLNRQQFQELYRIAEMGAILLAVMSLGIDEDKDTFAGKLKYYAIRELGTLYNALTPRTMLTAGVTIAFLEKLSQNLYLLMTLEKYKTRDELKGVAALKKQLTPAAISQFKGKKKPEPKVKKGRLKGGLVGGRLKSRLK